MLRINQSCDQCRLRKVRYIGKPPFPDQKAVLSKEEADTR